MERSPEAYAYPLLIKHLLHSPLAHAPEQEIVYRDSKRYDYRTLRKRIAQLADGLAQLGVKPGDTVAVMDWDSHRYLESYFAVPMMGAVLLTVNVRLSPEQILYTLNHAESDVLLVHSDFLPVLEGIKDRLETVKKFVLLTDSDEGPASSCAIAAEYEEMLAASRADYDFEDFDENTRATTFYTTGTTGLLLKGVFYTHRQLVLHTLAVMAAMSMPPAHQRFHRGDVYMPITPMFHVHAWGMPYVATAMGVKQVYPGRYAPDVLLKLFQREKVTFSHCVPTVLQMLLSCPASQTVDLSRWKVVIGGSAFPKGLAKAAMDRNIDVFAGYGMSETCPVLTLAQLKPGMDKLDTNEQVEIRTKTGLPVQLVDLRIVDDQRRDVPQNGKTTGEIVVRAPWLTQAYFKDPENSKQLWRGGYLHTGDVATIDSRGYVQIGDRLKDVIKTGGEWISSLQIESIISQHESVSEAAVIGVRDDKWGERALALVVLKPEGADRITEDDIKAHVRDWADKGIIPKWAVPCQVKFVTAIAKTSVGKIDKKTLRKEYDK